MLDGEICDSTHDPLIKSRHDFVTEDVKHNTAPAILPSDLIGRTFLMEPQEDGQRHRARITELINNHESEVANNPAMLKFRISINEEQAEDVITYNQMLDYISKDESTDIQWKYKAIKSHEGPYNPITSGTKVHYIIYKLNGRMGRSPGNH